MKRQTIKSEPPPPFVYYTSFITDNIALFIGPLLLNNHLLDDKAVLWNKQALVWLKRKATLDRSVAFIVLNTILISAPDSENNFGRKCFC